MPGIKRTGKRRLTRKASGQKKELTRSQPRPGGPRTNTGKPKRVKSTKLTERFIEWKHQSKAKKKKDLGTYAKKGSAVLSFMDSIAITASAAVNLSGGPEATVGTLNVISRLFKMNAATNFEYELHTTSKASKTKIREDLEKLTDEIKDFDNFSTNTIKYIIVSISQKDRRRAKELKNLLKPQVKLSTIVEKVKKGHKVSPAQVEKCLAYYLQIDELIEKADKLFEKEKNWKRYKKGLEQEKNSMNLKLEKAQAIVNADKKTVSSIETTMNTIENTSTRIFFFSVALTLINNIIQAVSKLDISNIISPLSITSVFMVPVTIYRSISTSKTTHEARIRRNKAIQAAKKYEKEDDPELAAIAKGIRRQQHIEERVYQSAKSWTTSAVTLVSATSFIFGLSTSISTLLANSAIISASAAANVGAVAASAATILTPVGTAVFGIITASVVGYTIYKLVKTKIQKARANQMKEALSKKNLPEEKLDKINLKLIAHDDDTLALTIKAKIDKTNDDNKIIDLLMDIGLTFEQVKQLIESNIKATEEKDQSIFADKLAEMLQIKTSAITEASDILYIGHLENPQPVDFNNLNITPKG